MVGMATLMTLISRIDIDIPAISTTSGTTQLRAEAVRGLPAELRTSVPIVPVIAVQH